MGRTFHILSTYPWPASFGVKTVSHTHVVLPLTSGDYPVSRTDQGDASGVPASSTLTIASLTEFGVLFVAQIHHCLSCRLLVPVPGPSLSSVDAVPTTQPGAGRPGCSSRQPQRLFFCLSRSGHDRLTVLTGCLLAASLSIWAFGPQDRLFF
jgi:hypothetical protein